MNEDEVREILMSHGYETQGELGHGGYAIIFKVRSQKYQKIFVAKAMFFDSRNGEARRQAFEVEVDTLIQLVHPNVVKIYDSFCAKNYYVQILELCENGSLTDKLKESGRLPTNKVICYIRPVIDALIYVHSNNIAHCDIKPSNILLDKYDRPILADFGLAQKIFSDMDELHFRGSRAYMAPEIFTRSPYDPFKADVWSLGVTIFELAAGRLPWNPNKPENMVQMIRNGMIQFPTSMEPILCTTIRKLLITNPKHRPTAEGILSLPLFANVPDSLYNDCIVANNNHGRRIRRLPATQSRGSFNTLNSSLLKQKPGDDEMGRRSHQIRTISSGIFANMNLAPVLTFADSNIVDGNMS